MGLKRFSLEELSQGILAGNRNVLSKAITLVESTLNDDKLISKELIKRVLPYSGNSFRLGISGVPGVGKSTFIDVLGQLLLKQGKRIAILTIDPSSNRSSGSILGDKTRMSSLAGLSEVFIRPSPSSNLLGGVGRCTAESILLCEAAGFDFIIVETVGVGQSEIQVKNMVDFFMVMLLPGGGDDLQGIKKGIIEEADLIVINKAEGGNELLARESKMFYESAMQFGHEHKQVLLTSAKTKKGMDELLEELMKTEMNLNDSGLKIENRKQQKIERLKAELPLRLQELFFQKAGIKQKWMETELRLLDNELTVEQGLDDLMDWANYQS